MAERFSESRRIPRGCRRGCGCLSVPLVAPLVVGVIAWGGGYATIESEGGQPKPFTDARLSEVSVSLENGVGDIGFEDELAQATVPDSIHAKADWEKVKEGKEIIYQVSPLGDEWVEKLFNEKPKENEKWWAVVHITVYPEDGGTEQVGFPFKFFGERSVSLTGKGIDAVAWAAKTFKGDERVEKDAHDRDGEETITFVKVVKDGEKVNKVFSRGVMVGRHGDYTYYESEELMTLGGHPLFVESVNKAAKYSSVKECNTETGVYKFGILGQTIGRIEFLRDRCEVGFLDRPKLNKEHNVGERDDPKDPFKTSESLIEKYGEGESAWGPGRADNEFGPDGRAEFDWWPPQDPELIEALEAMASD